MSEQRWFSPETLRQLAQPSTDRIIGLLEHDETERARAALDALPQEWAFLHKLMADSVAATIDYVEERASTIMARNAIDYTTEKAWRSAFVHIEDSQRARVAAALNQRWQQESAAGCTLQEVDSASWPDRSMLRKLTRPRANDEAVKRLDEGDRDGAIEACRDFRHEWGLVHDLLVESVAALLTFIGRQMGEDAVGPALDAMIERVWSEPFQKIEALDRKTLLQALAATWRAHSTEGVGPQPGHFTIEEDDEKFTFVLDPAGSGGRLYRRSFYEPPKNYAKTERAHPWSFNREQLPYYCAHCTYMNEILPIRKSGVPLYPLDPPTSPDDVCRWYLYKDPADTPSRFYERYGFDRETELERYRKRTGKSSN